MRKVVKVLVYVNLLILLAVCLVGIFNGDLSKRTYLMMLIAVLIVGFGFIIVKRVKQ